MSQRLTERQIDVAVEWWAGKVRGPVEHHAEHPGANDRSNRMIAAVGRIASAGRLRVTEGQALLFSEALRAALRDVDLGLLLSIGVEYRPDRILQDALTAAEILDDFTVLPWKTVMWFDGGGVQVAEGYGAGRLDLLASEVATR